MKSVKKVISKIIYEVDLRNYTYTNVQEYLRLTHTFSAIVSMELPSALSYGDLFRSRSEVNFSGLQPENPQRRSTAYSSPDQGNLPQCEPIDISIEPDGSLVENDNPRRQPEVGLEEFHPCCSSSPSRSRDPYLLRTAPQAEDSYDCDDAGEESGILKVFPQVDSSQL